MSKKSIAMIVAAAAVLLVAAILWVFLGRARHAPAPPPPPPPTPTPAPTPTPSPFSDVSLAGSDEAVRAAAEPLSTDPAWARWLAHEDLVRRFVASVAMIAEGRSPRNQVPFLRPKGRFTVVERDGTVVPSPESWRRYDRIVAVVTAIDPVKAAALYRELEPLIGEAYREISRPGAEFRDVLAQAIRHLLETPVPEEPPALEEKVVTWRYADPALENLSDAQRQLLRLGPENARRIQRWLASFLDAVERGGPPGSQPVEHERQAS